MTCPAPDADMPEFHRHVRTRRGHAAGDAPTMLPIMFIAVVYYKCSKSRVSSAASM